MIEVTWTTKNDGDLVSFHVTHRELTSNIKYDSEPLRAYDREYKIYNFKPESDYEVCVESVVIRTSTEHTKYCEKVHTPPKPDQKVLIIAVTVAGAVVLIVIIIASICCCYRLRARKTTATSSSLSTMTLNESLPGKDSLVTSKDSLVTSNESLIASTTMPFTGKESRRARRQRNEGLYHGLNEISMKEASYSHNDESNISTTKRKMKKFNTTGRIKEHSAMSAII